MKKYFNNLNYKIQGFMQGRYGNDELSRFISIIAFIFLLLACFIPKAGLLSFVGLLLFIWSWFRTLSKNTGKRRLERDKYLTIREKITQKFNLVKNKWRDRKTHRYYKCPNCKVTIRIPKPGKHKTIGITCPKCKKEFTKRT